MKLLSRTSPRFPISRHLLPCLPAMGVLCLLAGGAVLGEPAKNPAAPLLELLKKKMPPKDLTPDEAERVMHLQNDLVILDVRTSEEFALSHIRGAINLDFFDRDFAEKLKKYEGKPVLVHCASGGRSGQTIQKIKDANYPAIYHLKDGFSGWQAAGKPTTK
jgi:phage shock protein E